MPFFKKKKSDVTRSPSKFDVGRSSTSGSINGTSSESSSLSDWPLGESSAENLLSLAESSFDPTVPLRAKSRLSKTLCEVLQDHSAMAYFIQYMEAVGAGQLVRFWMEAESFRSSAWTRIQGNLSAEDRDGHPATSSVTAVCSAVSRSCTNGEKPVSSDNGYQSNETGVTSEGRISTSVNEARIREADIPVCAVPHSTSGGSDDGVFDSRISLPPSPIHRTPFIDRVQFPDSHVSSVYSAADVSPTSRSSVACSSLHEPRDFSNSNATVPHVVAMPDRTRDEEKCHDLAVTGRRADAGHLCNGAVRSLCKTEEESLRHAGHHASSSNHQSGDGTLDRNPRQGVEQDAWKIYKKYIVPDAPYSIGVSPEHQNGFVVSFSSDDGCIDPDAFVRAQSFVETKMENDYFPAFLRSTFHCKHQIDVLTSGSVFLADILYNDAALFYFMEFMEQESVRHLVDFLLMTDNFRNQLLSHGSQYDRSQAQDDAMVLYDKYFSLQATMPLGFSDTIRFETEQNICKEDGVEPCCFQKPVRIIMQYLEKTYLPQFLCSQLYFKYLSECINTIQMNSDLVGPRKRSGSDSSNSEHSASAVPSSTNTLLAMGNKHPLSGTKKILRNIEDQDMRIDAGQFNPNSLWKRNLAGSESSSPHRRLQMARIDKFGKLVSEFEPEPGRKRGSMIPKAVRKLVNRDEDKTQEDMAWQVAQMIVKDVCSLTLAPDEMPPEVRTPSPDSGIS